MRTVTIIEAEMKFGGRVAALERIYHFAHEGTIPAGTEDWDWNDLVHHYYGPEQAQVFALRDLNGIMTEIAKLLTATCKEKERGANHPRTKS
jgi:hypothetical protein